ncbi:LOW QUALITY PROTEIN: bombesin receptor subtype-3-like [Amphiura filiformis]|uniref:LOW QUALITY PROTEIN: bombesin receptor subtype-3-like n=1 Tax=Amphiura filiformis TaxID=82378 RepID=UPI003B228E15
MSEYLIDINARIFKKNIMNPARRPSTQGAQYVYKCLLLQQYYRPLYNGSKLNPFVFFDPLDVLKDICWRSVISTNFVVVFLIIVTFIGLTGNVGLLLVVLRNPVLRSAPNILIINIVVSDLLYISSTAPFYTKHEFGRPCWLMGSVACKFRHYIPMVCQASCIFSLTALSRERYSAIVHGVESRISRSLKRTFWMVAAAWLAGLFVGIPVLFFTKTTHFDIMCLYMPVKSKWAQTYMVFIFAFLYIIPLLFITIHHFCIVKELYHSNVSVLAQNPSAANQIRARKRLAQIVLVITIFFAVFWFPHYAYTLWFMFTRYSKQITENKGLPKVFRHFNYYMALANSLLNPWIVFIMSSVHRNTLMQFVDCLRCAKGKRVKSGVRVEAPSFSRVSTSYSRPVTSTTKM